MSKIKKLNIETKANQKRTVRALGFVTFGIEDNRPMHWTSSTKRMPIQTSFPEVHIGSLVPTLHSFNWGERTIQLGSDRVEQATLSLNNLYEHDILNKK